ncbi:MAG: hypothetical protein ACKO0M_02420, partial [Cyanobium sp.]
TTPSTLWSDPRADSAFGGMISSEAFTRGLMPPFLWLTFWAVCRSRNGIHRPKKKGWRSGHPFGFPRCSMFELRSLWMLLPLAHVQPDTLSGGASFSALPHDHPTFCVDAVAAS